MGTTQEHPLVSSTDTERSREKMEEKETLFERAIRYTRNLAQFVRLLIGLLLDERVDKKVKIFAGAVLTYVFAPVDFIPEIFSGLFGMLDDFVLSAFALNVIVNWVDPQVVKSHWRGDKDLLETIQKGIKNAEVLVPEAVLKKIQLWIGKHQEKAMVPVPAEPQKPSRPRKRRTVRSPKSSEE
jgi:uncharacterized membrane protein YkvA (DUF1232 family)